jgi:hypothetical protein
MATYHSQNHSKYLLQVHLVFSAKYRKKILTGVLSDDLKQIMYDITNERDTIIKAMETASVLELVNNFKSMGTFRIYKKHKAFLKSHY